MGILGGDPLGGENPVSVMRAQVYSGAGVESLPVWAASTFMLLPRALETFVKMDEGGKGAGPVLELPKCPLLPTTSGSRFGATAAP